MAIPCWRGLVDMGALELKLSGNRAEATTRVLTACAGAVSGRSDATGAVGGRQVPVEADPWRLTLAGRIGGLAAVLRESQPDPELAVSLRCPDGACGEPFEAGIPLEVVARMGEDAEAEPVVEAGMGDGQTVRVRRPTGLDLRRWGAAGWSDPAEAERGVARSLVEATDLDLETVAPVLAERMASADPLPAFRLVAACPACGLELERAVDLESALLARLSALQKTVLRDVHRLASRYGWSEAEVLAVPGWRRAAYLSLIDAEGTTW